MPTIAEFCEQNKITISAEFIPWSKSRSYNGKLQYPTRLNDAANYNYRVTILRNGKPFFTSEYSMGIAYGPNYKQGKMTYDDMRLLEQQIETGKRCRMGYGSNPYPTSEKILPKLADVIHSCALDSDALNYADFDEWAASFGYDTDSIKARKIYDDCLACGLAFRSALGEKLLAELSELCRDY
jgi:hypothetical protein